MKSEYTNLYESVRYRNFTKDAIQKMVQKLPKGDVLKQDFDGVVKHLVSASQRKK